MTETMTGALFMERLSELLAAKMEQQGVTYSQLAKELKISKNYAFRARQGGEDPRYLMGVSPSLVRLMDYVDIEPADLLGRTVRPGDIEVAISHDPRLDGADRTTLIAIVRAFYRNSGQYAHDSRSSVPSVQASSSSA